MADAKKAKKYLDLCNKLSGRGLAKHDYDDDDLAVFALLDTMDESLEEHDDRFHNPNHEEHGHFDPETMTCGKRKDMAKDDGGDNLKGASTQPRKLSKKEQIKALILKKRPDIGFFGGKLPTTEEEINHQRECVDGIVEDITNFPDSKTRKAALHWFLKGSIRLPEDAPKVKEAIQYGERAKGKPNTDPMSFDSPMAMIEALHEFKPKAKPIDPDTVPELSNKKELPMGVTTYLVQDDHKGQQAMREIIDTHWGEDANPWCLLARNNGDSAELEAYDVERAEFWTWWENLSSEEKNRIGETDIYKDGEEPKDEDADADAKERAEEYYEAHCIADNGGEDRRMRQAWHYWKQYSALPKRVAFKNGKLLAFMATDAGDDNYIGDDSLREMFPEYEDEYQSHITWYDGYESFMRKEHADDLRESGIDRVPEQWWDRQDKSHEGIPLGNIPVPGDAFGRWADLEIRDGKVHQKGKFYKKLDNGSQIEWCADGYITRISNLDDKGRVDAKFYKDGKLESMVSGYTFNEITVIDGEPCQYYTGFARSMDIVKTEGGYKVITDSGEVREDYSNDVTELSKYIEKAESLYRQNSKKKESKE